jgi:hypothetical protein
MPAKDISKIMGAGVVNATFRAKLLNPDTRMKAIEDGYLGEEFNLNDDERKRLTELGNFETLAGFAQALSVHEGNGTERRG